MGKFSYFLGLEASYLSIGSVHISQTKYASELLKRAGMETANSMPTPMMSNTKLSAHYSEPFHDPKLYRSIVGALQYLTMTRPDIAFAVNRVSQFMHQPTLLHWKSVKRILRYVKGTVDHGLLFSKSTDFRLLAFSDADWGGDLDDRKSITGFCVYLGCNLISWKSNKQTKVSRSSTEAEYRTMCAAQTELMSIQQLLGELRIPQPMSPTIFCDNQSACLLAVNPVLHSRSAQNIELKEYNSDNEEEFKSNYEIVSSGEDEDEADSTMNADVAEIVYALAN
ncbi:uncharacterized mitochondrial protein AtMg00810-like [Arachis duranensis]|uniref:Uncharacterized mitochondrial protein AtMg00810-like n=1 Tax=Arachis duranensis TaxID=130453 RepID=A0A9C6TR93_ARADU|nr:uncharacterized mitochondrial protein AtMg00810-like [Arachis duranensis]